MMRIRVDWFRTIVELERQGYTPGSIAASIDVSRTTILGWRNYSAEPAHDAGERLIGLWCRVLDLPRDALPLNVDDLLSAARAKAPMRK
ncbi:MAG: hypothetical protein KDH93_19540 [Rhodoferax sp.]|nr:hypothetical protein [Rhodoferax sp.]